MRRITLDTCCINTKAKVEPLNKLERWASEGLLQLQRSEAMLGEIQGDVQIAKAKAMPQHPDVFILDQSLLNGPDVVAGSDLAKPIRSLLFPTAKILTHRQQCDVEHLSLHVRTGGDVFVTLNKNDFITRGRRDTLTACGVWVMEPQELVELLMARYGWQ